MAYGSQSSTSTKIKYGHIETEAQPAIVYGREHFHMYQYCKKFELETDRKPLPNHTQPALKDGNFGYKNTILMSYIVQVPRT